MSLIALILPIMFFALARHDEPAHPAVIERRANQKQLPYE
jgi:hypothetical protein